MGWLVLALILLFAWSLAEAMMWPIIPDAALAAVVYFFPDLALLALPAVVLGSATGGTIGISLLRAGRRYPLPMVTSRMQEKVRRWLARGPIGLAYQPPTAVPYKVFVVEAARRGFRRSTWAVLTVLFRGARMTLVTFGALGAAKLTESAAPGAVWPAKSVVAGVLAVIFLAGWRLAYVIWSRPASA